MGMHGATAYWGTVLGVSYHVDVLMLMILLLYRKYSTAVTLTFQSAGHCRNRKDLAGGTKLSRSIFSLSFPSPNHSKDEHPTFAYTQQRHVLPRRQAPRTRIRRPIPIHRPAGYHHRCILEIWPTRQSSSRITKSLCFGGPSRWTLTRPRPGIHAT
jgi:hypothetical protein